MKITNRAAALAWALFIVAVAFAWAYYLPQMQPVDVHHQAIPVFVVEETKPVVNVTGFDEPVVITDEGSILEPIAPIEPKAEVVESRTIDEPLEPFKRRRMKWLPHKDSGDVGQMFKCDLCSVLFFDLGKEEPITNFAVLEIDNGEAEPTTQVICIAAKPKTRVLMTQTFRNGQQQQTKFVMGGEVKPEPDPDPPKPDPDPPKPDPEPDPPEPVAKYEEIHLVIVENPLTTTPQQSGVMLELRQMEQQNVADFASRMTIYDVKGQDETGQQSANVLAYIKNIDTGKNVPYWFVVGLKDGKGDIISEGEVSAMAEIVDEIRQANKLLVPKQKVELPNRSMMIQSVRVNGAIVTPYQMHRTANGVTYWYDGQGRITYGNCQRRDAAAASAGFP